jgi:hypothetical protein
MKSKLSRGRQKGESIASAGPKPSGRDWWRYPITTPEVAMKIGIMAEAAGLKPIHRQNYKDSGRDHDQVPRIIEATKTGKRDRETIFLN